MLHFLNGVVNDTESTQKSVNTSYSSPMSELINRIPGLRVLKSSIASRFNNVLKALPVKLDIKSRAIRHALSKLKIVSEYDQEIPQSQTADNPWHREEEPLNHHETPGRQIKQSNQLSLPHQDNCNTRMDIK